MGHADETQLSTFVGSTINRAGAVGILTDAGVAAADTLDGLDAFINGVNVPGDISPLKAYVKAAIRKDAGITNATVLSLTTVAGLAALTSVGSRTQLQEVLGLG
jgi:hypothetical protein